VYETADDLERLDARLQASIERAGPFLRSSFQMPEHSLNARRLTQAVKGVFPFALATVSA
jgi:hypothetical protein